ncbi:MULTISPECIES: universal stress protein [Enterococcus]|uniref:Universal stress protein n=1 Tax=Enterococcus alishanensis TaxID=1303817 RepID=A0ABS6TB37_9ENTE|nr:universal stress protein [Enterococcus alishanensis]MBV7390117.1 universal stress protein [Enterococcus alishanensis]
MKTSYRNILVALDGSEQADNALLEAVETAKRNDTKLYLVSVIDDSNLLMNTAIPVDKVIEEEKSSVNAELTKKIKEIDYPKAEILIAVGNPKKYLTVDLPKSLNIDLIFLGATGKGRIERILVGSVANYVVNHAPCNVMVVRD